MKKLKFLFFLIIFSSCVTDVNKIKEITLNDDAPFEIMKDVQLFYSDSAIIKVELLAETIERFLGKRKEIIFPEGLEVTFYSDGISVESTLSANYAIKKLKTNVTEVKENVVLQNSKGEKLNTEHLIWLENEGLLRSDEEVTITTSDEIIQGKGFEADQEFAHYKIKNITGVITLNEDE